ncbi:MAG: hypothetical protein ABIR62_05065 [Dokdonella sp.]|uniref:hypothetical protein n=1 Tax=Dokdonella sp. TaxID=2291710 RepID=UPI0032640B4D
MTADSMVAFFGSGRIVDLVLAVMLVEALALGLYFRRTSSGISFTDLLINLASGTCLLFALRAALTGQSWTWIAVALVASLIGHLLDLSRRWRPASPRSTLPSAQEGSPQDSSQPDRKKTIMGSG